VRQRIGMPRLLAARRPAEDRVHRDHGHFDLFAARYKYLRTFTPAVIAALPLVGNTASPTIAALLRAVDALRELNAAGRTTVPNAAMTAAATAFVTTPAGAATWAPPGARTVVRRTGTIGSSVCSTGCRLGFARGTCGCPAHAATPTRQPCSCRPSGGQGSATTSAP
jgi:hypothetical protein